MIHTIRQVINDDEKFRKFLRGLNKSFYHQTVTTKQIEDYISAQSGKDFSKVFDQYLRTTKIPTLEYKTAKNGIQFRWTNVVDGFNMPLKINDGKDYWIKPKKDVWTTLPLANEYDGKAFEADKNFYIFTKKVD